MRSKFDSPGEIVDCHQAADRGNTARSGPGFSRVRRWSPRLHHHAMARARRNARSTRGKIVRSWSGPPRSPLGSRSKRSSLVHALQHAVLNVPMRDKSDSRAIASSPALRTSDAGENQGDPRRSYARSRAGVATFVNAQLSHGLGARSAACISPNGVGEVVLDFDLAEHCSATRRPRARATKEADATSGQVGGRDDSERSAAKASTAVARVRAAPGSASGTRSGKWERRLKVVAA